MSLMNNDYLDKPCPFQLYRENDDGTPELVADGVRWSDGSTDIHWKDLGNAMWTSTHDGKTLWIWPEMKWTEPNA